MTVTDWFARPIVNVTDVEASLRFYVERLGFTCPWRFDEDGESEGEDRWRAIGQSWITERPGILWKSRRFSVATS